MTIKVKLRQKNITGKRQSLYLDFYPAVQNSETGEKTRRGFLNLFLNNEIEIEEQKYFDKNGKEQRRFVTILDEKGKPKKVKLNPIDKLHNKETLQLAEQIRQKKDNQLNKPEIYTGYEKEQLKIIEQGEKSFTDYFQEIAKKRNGSNLEIWLATFNFIKKFTNNKLQFSNLKVKYCNNFREYLLTTHSNKSKKRTLSQNSASVYFNTFKASLKQAYKDGYLLNDLSSKIESIKEVEIQRNFLTIEELNKLQKTECRLPLFKQAALFSALTGLRYIDIENLIWEQVEYIKDNGYFVKFKQQKTKAVEMMPISNQAYQLLGERKVPTERIFKGLYYSAWVNKQFKNWVINAGITKKITFHCCRHTFATLQLSLGTDIYTVSKLLGHSELKHTQIYAKIIDQTKREAANKIKLDL